MLVPYFSYGILIMFLFFAYTPTMPYVVNTIKNLLYGGMILRGAYGVFWFITVLLVTQLLFGFLSRFSKTIQVIIIVSLYVLAHIHSMGSYAKVAVPGNIDVVMLTLTYYSLGFYGKEILKNAS